MAHKRVTQGRVKIAPDDIPHLVEAVKKAGAARLKLSDRALDYWIAGELPKAVHVLLDNPDLALALYKDAERRALLAKIEGK